MYGKRCEERDQWEPLTKGLSLSRELKQSLGQKSQVIFIWKMNRVYLEVKGKEYWLVKKLDQTWVVQTSLLLSLLLLLFQGVERTCKMSALSIVEPTVLLCHSMLSPSLWGQSKWIHLPMSFLYLYQAAEVVLRPVSSVRVWERGFGNTA